MTASVVEITISNRITGTSLIVPYSHEGGLQRYATPTSKAGQPVIYRISKYQVRVAGGGTYHAVRFGLQNKGTIAPSRRSDAGLSAARVCFPQWVTGYSPHSFRGGPFAGAWRLLAGRGFLIHEGADSRAGGVGGSLGCVEILDGGWQAFQNELRSLSGADWPVMGAKNLLKVTIEAASYPTATLAS